MFAGPFRAACDTAVYGPIQQVVQFATSVVYPSGELSACLDIGEWTKTLVRPIGTAEIKLEIGTWITVARRGL